VSVSTDLEVLLARIVEHHTATGVLLPVEEVAADRPELAAALADLVRNYLALMDALDGGLAPTTSVAAHAASSDIKATTGPLVIDGFRTIERLGAGGMGEVYKLQDLKLDRVVAAKVIRRREAQAMGLAEFLREARSLALFSDPRVVRIFEYREAADPPVIIMEYVEGFELGKLGPSLEFRQRGRILREICEAIHHAHSLGIQHRDLKPSNIMLDGRLEPKILDFGLSEGDPTSGHLRGTVQYIAPEQLDPTQPIDGRTDVYALGVILYELLTGVVPYSGATQEDVIGAIRRGQPRLPVEIDTRVPEPLQAIALKAMERRPADRYPSAREMSIDLGRYLDGLPVTARPSQYGSTLQARVSPHLDQIAEWQRLNLIYPHEATRLQTVYRQLEAREDDWIVASRSLSYSQILLYLGAFLLFAGSLFYFLVHRVHKAVSGLAWPFVVLGVPFIGLNIAGRWLYRREHRAVAVAFYLAGVSLLPLFLLIWFYETGIWVVPAETTGQLFTDASVSNRQLQITVFVACLWSGWLALKTRTAALSSVFTLLVLIFAFAVLADFGLRDWLTDGEFDRLALRLWPVVAAYAALGGIFERRRSPWFARPLYVAGVIMLIVVLDLLAIDGRMFHYLGLSLKNLQPADVSSPTLLDTMAALTLNGLTFYAVASIVERGGTDVMTSAAQLLFICAPFSMLEPLAYLCETGEYSFRIDWLYLAFALAIALLSRQRQRKSFYYAGLVNTGFALYLIADHRQWFDNVGWAAAIVAAGLLALLAGFLFDTRRGRGRT
jgi:serine/threonine protein kinase